ncbi:MAG: trypsin-like peptidase domain-containing protein [Chloroflexi bacterium]|nr:trypsin-like peptidase domain-containing protein [Chloroflexota bacterium]
MNWSDVLKEHRIEEATYIIGYAYTRPSDGQRYFYNYCSAFAAYYTGAIWTNAHCVDGLLDIDRRLNRLRNADPEYYIVQSGVQLGIPDDRVFRLVIDSYWKHPDYDDTTRSEDVGLFDIEGRMPVLFDLLPRRFADDIAVGQPVGTLGFPGELGSTGGGGSQIVTPTFKDGVVSALRTVTSGNTDHIELQYNFDTSPGTSGSPVFDHDGWIVAINHAGIQDGTALNFGISVEAMWGFLDYLEAGRGQVPPPQGDAARRAYQYDTYRPQPEDWNGQTILP